MTDPTENMPERLTDDMVKHQIAAVAYIDKDVDFEIFHREEQTAFDQANIVERLNCITICLMVMRNGFVHVGKSGYLRTEDYDAQVGRNMAYDDAFRHAWAAEGYVYLDGLQRIYEEKIARIPANVREAFGSGVLAS